MHILPKRRLSFYDLPYYLFFIPMETSPNEQHPSYESIFSHAREIALNGLDVLIDELGQLDREIKIDKLFTPLPDDHEWLYRCVVAAISSENIAFSEFSSSSLLGFLLPQGGSIAARDANGGLEEIFVREGDSRNKTVTSLHEYAHIILARQFQDRSPDKEEVGAEASAYVVSHYFGLHDPFSAAYLDACGYYAEQLSQNQELILTTSLTIIAKLEDTFSREER